MLACLIVVVDLLTRGAFKLHRFKHLEAKSSYLLKAGIFPAVGTALPSSQPVINAAPTEQLFAGLTVFGVPNDAGANRARVSVIVAAAIYESLTLELDLVGARIRELIPQLA